MKPQSVTFYEMVRYLCRKHDPHIADLFPQGEQAIRFAVVSVRDRHIDKQRKSQSDKLFPETAAVGTIGVCPRLKSYFVAKAAKKKWNRG